MALDLGNMNLEERAKFLELKAQYGNKVLPWYKKWWGIIIIIILGIILTLLTAAGFYIWNQAKEYSAADAYSQQLATTKTVEQVINPETGYFLGTDNAVLTIIEFSDFACPYCEKDHTVLKKIINTYPGKVKIIYRDLPLHENSVDLAMSARCAGEQGYFWEMHDQLFANQNSLTVTGDELTKIIYGLAGSIGLDATAFDSCYQNKKYLNDISADYADATTLQLKGTPSWFLNNQLISGYIPENDFLTLLDAYFANLKK